MKKTLPLCLLLLALTLTATAALAAPAPAIAAPLAFFGTATGSCPTAAVTAPAPSAAADFFGALSCCRPECSSNSGCDKKCGKGLGTCVQVNSCCNQCICSQTYTTRPLSPRPGGRGQSWRDILTAPEMGVAGHGKG